MKTHFTVSARLTLPPKRGNACNLYDSLAAKALWAASANPGRVEWERARFRPMASDVSALSGIVANGHQIMPTFPPPPLFIPYGEFSPVRLETQPCRTVPFRRRLRLRLTPRLRSFWARLCVPAACNRYYGLMRQSVELRPAWASSACSGRSLPSRAVRLTFPSFLCHTVHACCDLYPVG